MIKKISFLLILFASCSVLATDFSELLSEDSPYLINLDEEVQIKDNTPLVYIQDVQAPERANNEQEALYIRLFGTKDIAKATRSDLTLDPGYSIEAPQNQEDNFTIQTPFGQTIKAGLIDHFSDFITSIQVLNQDTVLISEELSQMNTKSDSHFTRHLSMPNTAEFQLIESVQNGQTLPFDSVIVNKENLILRSPIPLDVGPNKIFLRYVLKGTITQQNGLGTLIVPLTTEKLPLPIDRMQTIVLFPDSTKIVEKSMLFGSNEQEIPDAVQIIEDIKGNIVYRLTHLVPAKAGVKIKVILDATSIPEDSWWNKFTDSDHNLFLTLMALCIALYLCCATVWELRKKKMTHLPIKIKLPFDLELPVIYTSRITSSFVSNIMKYKGNILLKLVSNLLKNTVGRFAVNAIIQFFVFCRIMGEMCIGVLLLILMTALIASIYSTAVPMTSIMCSILISLIALIFIYEIWLKQNYRNSLTNIVKLAMMPENLISLSTKQIQTLYPLMVAANQFNDWDVLLHKQNPNVHVLDKGV